LRVLLAGSHAHQAKALKCPQNENFIILQLIMRVQLIFFVLGQPISKVDGHVTRVQNVFIHIHR